ncbi:MAG: sugar ABC transporter permease [Lachnospiraceae bacterium]|nr:sugar ABC transporter permease [Lachnospiraceae bacterium]
MAENKTKAKTAVKKRKKLTLIQRRMLTGYLFILPWFFGFLYFYVRSIVLTVQFSFSELVMDIARGGYTLINVGFENYRFAFMGHGYFNQILTRSISGILVDVPLIIFFSLFIAILLNKKFPGRAIIRVIFFLPVIMASEAITASLAMSAQMMNAGISSTATEVASVAGSGGINVELFIGLFLDLGIPLQLLSYLIEAVVRINTIIAASGVQIIIFLAALQSIPGSLYEVANIEGATGYETFWKVTFPMMMPHIITNIVYTIVDSFVKSDVVNLAYSTTFSQFNYGLSSVFSIVSSVLTLAILFIVVSIIQKRTFYYN